MPTTITSIRRYGTQFRVSLACGHKFTITADTLRRDQLYIGKQVACGELHYEEKH